MEVTGCEEGERTATRTVVVLIGNSDNRLTQQQWAAYVRDVGTALQLLRATTYFSGGPGYAEPYQNACWVAAVQTRRLSLLRDRLTEIRQLYRQDSVAWLAGETEFL